MLYIIIFIIIIKDQLLNHDKRAKCNDRLNKYGLNNLTSMCRLKFLKMYIVSLILRFYSY